MSSVTVKLTGGPELQARLGRLAQAVQTKLGRKAVGAGAQVVKKAIAAKAPQYTEEHVVEKGGSKVTVQPGNLKKNVITKRLSRSSLTAEYIVTVRNDRKSGYAARYGRLVEFGTVNFSPRSYFRTGWESSKGDAMNRIITVLAEGISKAEKA